MKSRYVTKWDRIKSDIIKVVHDQKLELYVIDKDGNVDKDETEDRKIELVNNIVEVLRQHGIPELTIDKNYIKQAGDDNQGRSR